MKHFYSVVLISLLLYSPFTHAQSGIISSAPKGETLTFDLSTTQVYQQQKHEYSGIKFDVISQPDSALYYFPDIVTAFGFGTYVKGKVVGDTIFIATGQQVYHQDAVYNYGELDLYAKPCRKNGSSAEVTDETYIKFVRHADGSLTTMDGMGVAYTDQYGDLMGYNMNYYMRPFNLQNDSIVPPTDVADRQYCLSYTDWLGNPIYRLVNLRQTDSAIYLQGTAQQYAPQSWIRGSWKDSKVAFPSRQYQGVAERSFLDFFYAGSSDDSQSLGYRLDSALVMDYDAETGIYSSRQSMLEMVGNKILVKAYNAPTLRPYTPHEATPQAPQMLGYSDYSSSGFTVIRFNIAPVDVDGNYIDPQNITWRLIKDGQPYTFTTDKFAHLASDTQIFKWGFDDRVDIVFEACGLYNIWFYDSWNTLQAECTFTYKGSSHTALSNVLRNTTTGVQNVGSVQKRVAKTTFADITGRKATSQTKGIVIKKTTYEDGSVDVEKVVRK